MGDAALEVRKKTYDFGLAVFSGAIGFALSLLLVNFNAPSAPLDVRFLVAAFLLLAIASGFFHWAVFWAFNGRMPIVEASLEAIVLQATSVRLLKGDEAFNQFRRLFFAATRQITIAGGGALLGIDQEKSHREFEMKFYEAALARRVKIERIQRKENATVLWLEKLEELKRKHPKDFTVYWDARSRPSVSLNVFDERWVLIEIVESDLTRILEQGEGVHEVGTAILIDDSVSAAAVLRALMPFKDAVTNFDGDAIANAKADLQAERKSRALNYFRQHGWQRDIPVVQREIQIPDYDVVLEAQTEVRGGA